jgi:polar amino acid transport system permease protein
VNWDWTYAAEITPVLIEHFIRYTLVITLVATVVAAVVGLPLAGALISHNKSLARLTGWITDFVRGTPLLVQLFFLFYVLPEVGIVLSPFLTGVLGLGLHYACYYADVYRASILTVPKGQREAAVALSLPAHTEWTRVVLPQSLRRAAPSVANYVLIMFKESPYLALLTVPEIVQTAFSIGSANFRYVEPLTITGLVFLAVSYPTAVLLRRLENYADRNQKSGASLA